MHARVHRSTLAGAIFSALAVFLALPTTAAAQGALGQVVIFGDSLSDPGNGFVFTRSSSTPPDWGMGPLLIPDAPYARGGHHLTNGATWAEYLARPLGLARNVQPAFRSASPDALNFAIGTTRARDDGTNPSLALLVGAFLQRTGGVASSNALYVIQVGGNDVRDALATGDPFEALAILQAAADAIRDAIALLHAAGARNFLVWNVADVALTPAVRLLNAQMPGTGAAATLATTTFNALLVAAVSSVAALPGIQLIPFDAFGLTNDIVANPALFGLTNVTDACVTPGLAPFTCQNPDEYLFWDGIHPTTAAHGIIAGAIAQLLGL